jgi:hypothetical protein
LQSFSVPMKIFEVPTAKTSWNGNDFRNLSHLETRDKPTNSWSFGDCFAHG